MRTYLKRLIASALLLSVFTANTSISLAAVTDSFRVGFTVTSATTGGTTGGTTGATTGATTGTGGGGGPIQPHPLPDIYNVRATPAIHSSLVEFSTEPHTQSFVRYGETIDYEGGTVSGTFYQKEHAFTLTGLKADTLYYYSITVVDGFGGTRTQEGLTFRTRAETATPPVPPGGEEGPVNATTFTATPRTDRIDLDWIVPGNPNPEVRLVRSTIFYPADPNDGEIIFEGKGIAYPDKDVEAGKTYYYTLFTKKGNEFSSGVIAKATMPELGKVPLPPSSNPFENLPTSTTVDPKIDKLTLPDFLFIQDGVVLPVTDGRIAIDGTKNLTILLAYEKVPEILKTIGITLRDPDDSSKTFSFLLRVNEDKSAYVATIGPLGRTGLYNLSIIILDYKNQGLKQLKGALAAEVASAISTEHGIRKYLANYEYPVAVALLTLLVLLLIFLTSCHWRRKEVVDEC